MVCSKNLQFSVFSAQDIVRLSEFEVTTRDLYVAGTNGAGKTPAPQGLLDRRLVSPVFALRRKWKPRCK